MSNRFNSRLLALFVALFATGAVAAAAQSPTTTAAMRDQVAAAVGAPATSVEVSKSLHILTISRVDSQLNGSTHGGRNAEAEAITAKVSQTLDGLPDAQKLLTINVDYLRRAGSKGHGKLVDRIEFRRNANGAFVRHTT